MKFGLLALVAAAAPAAAWTLGSDGTISPDGDAELQGAPNAGARLSLPFSTLNEAKDAYYQMVLKTMNAIQPGNIAQGNA